MAVNIPPYLQKGDTIGMVCPSGYLPLEKARRCIETLEQWGFKVVLGKTIGHQHNYFSGTDEERLNDLQLMLDDENIKAIYCGRGGYGLSRIIDKINFKKFIEQPKWIIGYSDITLLHAHIFSNYNIAGLHAPMAAAFNEIEESKEYILSIYKSLIGEQQTYTCASHHLNRTGVCEGELVGGNLALLVHIIGSSSDIKTKNKILFIEDIGEYKYNIDRMLIQLKRAGKLDELAGLIIGNFSEIKDTAIPYGKDLKEIIFDVVKEYDYPIYFDFPVGHVKENYALKIGCKYDLRTNAEKVALKEWRNYCEESHMAISEPNISEVPVEFKEVLQLLQDAIRKRHFVKFYYESENGNKGFRTIPPYMIIPRKGVLELVGVPVEEQKKGGQPRHYIISQLAKRLKSNQLEILPERFDNPGVSKHIVVFTETPPICRFIYDDEDVKKVKAGWLKIEYIK